MTRKLLLVCGILSSLLYVAAILYVPTRWEGYSSASQVVSELSAIGAPTRALWNRLVLPYGLLLAACGCGVWLSAAGRRPLRVAGGAMIVQGLFGSVWPPMHLRGAAPTLTDTLHVVWAIGVLSLMLVAMVSGAKALGSSFRRFTLATIAVYVVFGVLTFVDAPRLAAGLPTPQLGIWERVNIVAFDLWVVVFAVALLRGGGAAATVARGARVAGA